MTAKGTLHDTVEALSERDASLLLLAIERHDPVLFALITAPEDDEPLIDGERAALAEADEETAQHGTISHEDLMRNLGLRAGPSTMRHRSRSLPAPALAQVGRYTSRRWPTFTTSTISAASVTVYRIR